MTRLLFALVTVALFAQQRARIESPYANLSCTIELTGAPHGASQHGPMVGGEAYQAAVLIDEGVFRCADGLGRWHLTAVKPRGESCRSER